MKTTLKAWSIYFGFVTLAVFVHELGHCVAGWVMGYRLVPTFAKEYPLESIPPYANPYISLGGILGNILFAAVSVYVYFKSSFKHKTSLLAAAVSSPGIYTLLFPFKGRGHDGTEFQEAQAAAGFSYAGHAADYLFLFMFVAGLSILFFTLKPGAKLTGRFLLGLVLTFFFIVALQVINNRIFDPLF